MKRTLLAAILATAAIAFSCTMEEPAQDNSVVMNPTATIANFVFDGPATKTTFALNDNVASFAFAASDVLRAYPVFPEVGDGIRFTVKGEPGTTCVFDGAGFGLYNGQKYAAYYPGGDNVPAVTAVPVDFSAQSQPAANEWNLSDVDFLYATGIEPANWACSFDMKHLGALLIMTVKFPQAGTFTKLTLESSADFVTAGTVDLTANEIAITPTATSKKIRLALGGDNGMAVEAGDEVTFYMMVPPVDMSNATLKIKLTDVNDVVLVKEGVGANFMAGHAIQITGVKPLVNLSAQGTANTYIVDVDNANSEGYYFDATKAGNGESTTNQSFETLGLASSKVYPSSGSISGAGVKAIWIENDCITDLAYNAANKTISFKATGAKGNAKVTLTSGENGTGDGVWTWLIWCTDKPTTISCNGYNVMDRNLGAITNQPSTDLHAQNGFYYQFGNPIPYTKAEFSNCDHDIDGMNAALALNPQKPWADGSSFWFNPWSSASFAKQVFGILWGGWSTGLVDVWGNYTQKTNNQIPKTKYDPCPVGYQVPSYNFFDGIKYVAGGVVVNEIGEVGRYIESDGNQLYFPANGGLNCASTAEGAYLWNSGEPNYYIFLWTLNHSNSNMAYQFVGGTGGSPKIEEHQVGYGCAVRCVASAN